MKVERGDAQILDEVLAAFRRDPQVGPAEVGVEVDGGVVTLTGTVDCYEKKLAAIELVHRAAGVVDVVNTIQIRVSGAADRTDTEIATAVRRAPQADAFVPDDCIFTTTSRGWVTLEGTVGRRRQFDAAEQAVRRVSGVVHVINDITVAPSVAVRPTAVHEGIEQAPERQTDREADHLISP
jgi:osmotically-inducible protein OsmY